MKDADSTIAAAARLGQTTQVVWRALLVGEVPKSIRTGPFANDKVAVYCDKLREVAKPLAERAIAAFEACHVKAIELGAGEAWTPTCRREGHLLAPEKFPDANELYAASAEPAPLLAVEPALR